MSCQNMLIIKKRVNPNKFWVWSSPWTYSGYEGHTGAIEWHLYAETRSWAGTFTHDDSEDSEWHLCAETRPWVGTFTHDDTEDFEWNLCAEAHPWAGTFTHDDTT